MSQAKITVQDNGPYEITGSFTVLDEEGHAFELKDSVTLCRCGYSHNKPFCDGTHEDIHFKSAPRADKEKLMVEV